MGVLNSARTKAIKINRIPIMPNSIGSILIRNLNLYLKVVIRKTWAYCEEQ